MLTAWLAAEHRTAPQWKRVRLGKSLNPEEAQRFKVLQRWADLIFIEDDTLFIVEAKLRPSPGAVGQLELYEQLLPETPEFKAFQNFPIKKILLTQMEDLSIRKFVEDKGIDFIIFNP